MSVPELPEVKLPQQTAFEKFIQQYNEEYVMKCKKLGEFNEYAIDSDGKPLTFARKRLTTKQFNELEQARSKVDKDNMNSPTDSMGNAMRTANLYLEVAQAYLKNKETDKAITKEEYENCIWEDIKIILDACHLRTVLGVGN